MLRPSASPRRKADLEDAAIEAAHDEHGGAIILFCEKAQQLDAILPGMPRSSATMSGSSGGERLAELFVVGSDDRFEPAFAGRVGEERGECRFIIDQQQARLRQIDLLSPSRPAWVEQHAGSSRRNAFLTLLSIKSHFGANYSHGV